jgi:monothiol glutaredoxin
MVYQQLEIPFVSVNILADSRAIPAVCEWSDWPTMPQCYIDGELIGGSDIVFEMFESGELLEMISEGK